MIPPPVFAKTPQLQFRAGRMKYADGKVTAEERKGYLSFFTVGTTTVEMIWSSTASNNTPIVLTRGKATAKLLEQCKTGRVLLIEAEDGAEKKLHFYWLQDKSEDKDNFFLSSLEQLLAEPPATANRSTVGLEDFKKILASVSKGKKDIKLTDVLSSSIVTEELIAEPALYKAKLAEHLPKASGESDDIISQVKNPQVSQAAAMLEAALQDPPTYKQLCASFGVPETETGGGVLAFLNGIIKTAKEQKES